MTDEASATPTRSRSRIELFATVLLAVAAVATAWSSYQANRWNGEQAKATSKTNALRIDAARAEDLANSETQVDIATFVQWVDAFADDAPGRQEFYEQRFRPEFKTAFDAWIALSPLSDPSAPLTPFAMPEYKIESQVEADRLDADAEASAATVHEDIQRSGNYVLAVVLFAVSLFFAGVSTKVDSQRARQILLGVGSGVFVLAVVWIATFPVTFNI